MATSYRTKLIETALPLDAINKESAREKSIRHGHPSTLHLWWARRPLAACRAVLFSSLVDDPSAWPDLFPTEEAQEEERNRLFEIIERLVIWENANDPAVLYEAHREIAASIARGRGETAPTDAEEVRAYLAAHAPPVLDPFCGGGSIPLEAQRLGLEAHGSDLNPVAVLITKALIEIPPKFAGKPPVNPTSREKKTLDGDWPGATGLAEDVRYYGQWMQDKAEKRIGHLYPKVHISREMAEERPDLEQYVGQDLTVIAWLWARTVPSPNPAVGGAHVPLIRSFWLSKKKGKEAWIEPVVDRERNEYRFEVRTGTPKEETYQRNDVGTKPAGRGSNFECILSTTPIDGKYIKVEGQAGRIASHLIAVVVEGHRRRVYLSPTSDMIVTAASAKPMWRPTQELVGKAADQLPLYGMKQYGQIFTPRQLTALTTFSDLVTEARNQILADATAAGTLPADDRRLADGGTGAVAYVDAVLVYLAFGISRLANRGSTISFWDNTREGVQQAFGRQAIPMTWDFCEANPFSESSGNWSGQIKFLVKVIANSPAYKKGDVIQADASEKIEKNKNWIISTDPPYYDNISYADLSDFFYVWLRTALNDTYPSLFATLLTPKSTELIASKYRHEGINTVAREFFEKGLFKTFQNVQKVQNPQYPLTIFYAFKQSEQKNTGNGNSERASTGWETMLSSLINSGFSIGGTWPVRTELTGNLKKQTSALASSIVLVCRPRPDDAPIATRREFLNALKAELPDALRRLQQGNIAPVDLAQSAIGPGMAVFTRYAKVMESDGSAMPVRSALALINQSLDEIFAEQEGEFDQDTRWAIAWFEQYGMNEGPYGVAETLSKAKNTAVAGLVEAGIIRSGVGKVQLLERKKLHTDWDPVTDKRFTIWEATQHLIRDLNEQGETGAAHLLKKLGGGTGEQARDLAYRLYSICERKKWAQEALAYNGLILSWPEITRLAQSIEERGAGGQTTLTT